MKYLFLLPAIIITLAANATNYYISSDGSDMNTGASSSTPWKSIDKLNSVFSTLSPGDSILFRRGDTFYGTITISRSGTAIAPITIGAYGTGASPVITGFKDVTSWTNIGNNIWQSDSISSLSYTNMLTVNGVNTAMGRYPNTGFLSYKSYIGNTAIVSSYLNSAETNWTGAELVIRKNNWTTERRLITNHSGTTLTYSGGGSDGTNNFGFFIQNDIRTLDLKNEWYFDKTNKKMLIYSADTPKNVKVATLSNLIYANGNSYINVKNIAFSGSADAAVEFFTNVTGCVISNCSVSFSGGNGIHVGWADGAAVDSCTVTNVNGTGIIVSGGAINVIISNNKVINAGLIMGITGHGIFSGGTSSEVSYNVIKNVGRNGIELGYGGSTVKYNFIDGFSLFANDAGGIYRSGTPLDSILVMNNIILNGIGNSEGTVGGVLAEGIYLDERANQVSVINNTIANCANTGIKLHMAHDNIIENNTTFNNNRGIGFEDYQGNNIRGNVISGNILFARTVSQIALYANSTNSNDITSYGIFSNNFFIKPVQPETAFYTFQPNTGGVSRDLQSWESFTGQHNNSKETTKFGSNENDLKFEYNVTKWNKTLVLDGKYFDMRGKAYEGSVELKPFTSVIIIKDSISSNISPVAIAGTSQTITLPINFILISGSGTDADGFIASYLWTKISGPTNFKIVNPSSPATDVTGMVEGEYVFQLKVTDDKGAIGTSTVKITVNPASNIAPVAVSGANKTITLPTNIVSLAGSGSDPDGKIVSYLWSKTSGPSSYKIVNPSSPVTDVTGLVEGEYIFELKVTDDKGASGKASVRVSVKSNSTDAIPSVANIPPKAYAGNDTTIAAPVMYLALKGMGTDPDGMVSGYFWSQISGPAKVEISPNNEAATQVSNLTEGTYEFELKVTDNDGSIGRDTIRVTVVATRLATELNNVKVNPNPVTDVVNLEISASKSYTNFTIIVSDVGGKSIYRDQFASQDRKFSRQVNMSSFERGTYIITVVFDRTVRISVKVARM
jgi:parallel beta-helix repeat protein